MSEKEIFFKITTKLATCKTFQPLPKSVDFRGLTIVVVANEELLSSANRNRQTPRLPLRAPVRPGRHQTIMHNKTAPYTSRD